MHPLLAIFLAWQVWSLANTAIQLILIHQFGVKLREITIGFGPKIYRGKVVKVGILPLGCSLQLATRESLQAGEPIDLAFNSKPVWQQLAMNTAGAILMLIIALTLFGDYVRTGFLTSFEQYFRGALAPQTVAQEYLDRLLPFVAEHGFIELWALITCKTAPSYLLPFPGTMSFVALTTLLFRGHEPDRRFVNVSVVLYLCSLPLIISWASALATFIWRHR